MKKLLCLLIVISFIIGATGCVNHNVSEKETTHIYSYDEFATEVDKIETSFYCEEISFSDYYKKINDILENTSLKETFKGETSSVCEFLDKLLTKGENRVNTILSKRNNQEISQKDSFVGIVETSNYFLMLADKTIFILTPNDNVVENINKISTNLSDNTKKFESYIIFVENMTDSWEEFRTIDADTKAVLATALMGTKLNPEELECAGMTAEEIVEKMCNDKNTFSQVKNVISKEVKETLKTIGTLMAHLMNELSEIIE